MLRPHWGVFVATVGIAGCGLDRIVPTKAGDSATDVLPESETGMARVPDTGRRGDCPEDTCHGECTNLSTDPLNCGACGVTCLVIQGEGVCDEGVCVLGDCDDGWGDCDGLAETGCESAVSCEVGGPCETECGSTGTQTCGDVCAPECALPAESCTAQDDDCDGECDEGELPGCRQFVYRSSGGLGHIYGLDPSEASALGQSIEQAQYFTTYAAETDGLTALYRCDKGGGKRFLTLSSTCEFGATPDLVVGWVSTDARCGAVPLYRLYSGAAGNHFYTLSAAERDNAVASYGYLFESVVAYVWTGL